MTHSPEIPRKKPKMAQGRKAEDRPLDDPDTRLNEFLRLNRKLKQKKIKEITDRQKQNG